jgi:glycosyltransferase involved in cell wall biosynthesis
MINFGLNTFYSSCKKVFVNSPHIMEELQKNKLLENKLVSLPYPLDKNRFPKVTKKEINAFKNKYLDVNKKTILCVASVQSRKGIFEFVQIAKELPKYNFMWVGDIPKLPYLKNKPQIYDLVNKNKPDNLIFPGKLFKKDLACAYSACDLFWLPSFSETFGLVIIEAASFNKPVLIRNIPIKKLFFEFINVYSSNPKSKIIKILEHGESQVKLKQKIKTSLNKFSIDKHTDKLISEYEKVINDNVTR